MGKSTSGGKNVATTKTDHKSVAAPQTSLCPPPPPGAPVPTPFNTSSVTSSAKSTASASTFGGAEAVTDGSSMDTQSPGNQQSLPTGGDIVSHGIAGTAGHMEVTSGASRTLVDGKGIATTGDSVAMNKPSPKGGISQQTGALVEGGGTDASSASDADAGGTSDKKTKAALAPKPGESETPAAPVQAGDPVTVATGFVVDEQVEFSLPGVIPLEWKRLYSSGRSKERGVFGKGGWTHTFAQWIEEGEAVWRFRAEDGRIIYFEKIGPRASTFHRRERLTLKVDALGHFEVESASSRLTRVFAPLEPGGPAVLRAIRDAYGNRIELGYEAGRLVQVIDTAGRALRLRHDERARITRAEVWSASPEVKLCQWVDFTYEPEGELASATDVLGGVLRYVYDGYHRMVKRTIQTGVSFHYTYDADHGRCVRTVGDKGIYDTELHFDFAKKTTNTSGNQEPRKYTWNAEGLVLREETLGGEWARQRAYDKDHYLLSEANAAGEKAQFLYDPRGNLIQRIDPVGNTTAWEVQEDRPVKRIDPTGLVTTYAYEPNGALAQMTAPTGQTYQLSYDGRGRLAAIHGSDGLLVGFAYDAQHNIVQETDGRGAVTKYTHDPLGRPVVRCDALGRVTRVDYDRLGQPIAISFPDGSSNRAEYDARGRMVRLIDGEGHVTTMEYAGLNALAKLVEPTGQVWSFAYDEIERIRRITNPRNETYEYHYDDAGRISEETSFHGRTLRYAYSSSGNLSRIDYPDKTWRSFLHDPLGNLVVDESPQGSIKLERDQLGHLKRAVLAEYNGKVVTAFERDRLGRIVAESQGERTIRYEYDARGRRVGRILPNGATTHYHYDPLGALVGVEHDGHTVAVYRDLLGREVRRHVHKGGVDVLSAYDARDRLCDQHVTAPGPAGDPAASALSRRRWSYDANGRVNAIEDARWGTTTYSHDELGQLVRAQRGKYQEVFEYDVTGSLQNVLKELSQVDRVRPWATREGNLLVETPEATYENDVQGRRTKRTDAATGRETEYFWDCRDRLREVRPGDGRRIRYTYDAFGRRVRKEIVPPERLDAGKLIESALEKGKGGLPKVEVTEFLWDEDALAAEVEGERGTRVFVHEPGTLIPMLQQEQGTVFTYVNDHLGMPKELVDQDGRVAWAAAHSAWGRDVDTWRDPLAKTAIETPFRLLGQYLDQETGLCYTRFRYFDEEVGRWLSPDPIGLLGGRNLFAFDGSPISATDPLGLSGYLYRGERSSKSPDVVFPQGIQPKGTNTNLLEHATTNTAKSIYVPTSKDLAIGEGFAGKNGWVYVIDSDRGIDLNSTLGPKSPFPEQNEVAMPGGILPEEIVGGYKVNKGIRTEDLIPNPNYQKAGCG